MDSKAYMLRLQPVFTENVWGGTRLKSDFGYDIPYERTGECWGIAAHPHGDNKILNPEFEGETLAGLWSKRPELFGGVKGDRFPLLIKIIDAKDNLSIQVHPDDAYAKEYENGSFGKTECWYVLDCPDNAQLVIGHNAETREELSDMIHGGRWKDLLRYVPVKKGDLVPIPAGTVHAITAGMLVLETQQNSDITYRMYDYDRLMNGKPRQLHIKQCIDVINVPAAPADKSVIHAQEMGRNGWAGIYACDYFSVFRMELDGQTKQEMDAPFVDVSIVDGEGELNGEKVKKGDHFILTAGFGQQNWSGKLLAIASTATI
ncbi:MAG: type I phosphomannose isomerase catalytic subunit [Lachnospiraceae bacterium]|jgi:mannose-6-phosphate isomerase class I